MSTQTCLVAPFGLRLNGVVVWSLRFAEVLHAAGRDVRIISHDAPQPQGGFRAAPQIVVTDAPSIKWPPITPHRAEKYLPAYFSDTPITLIPNYSDGAYTIAALLSQQHSQQLRVIGTAHSDDPEHYLWLETYEPIIHRFIAVSDEIAYTLAQRLPHRAGDIVTLPYAVPDSPTELRDPRPQQEPLRLLYAGRLDQTQKRVSDLPRLASLLKSRHVNFKLRIIGDGTARRDLQAAIAALSTNARSCVTLDARPLPPDRMLDAWTDADVIVLTSAYEGTSVAMLDAMSRGAVPVVTQVSGVPAVLGSDASRGLTFPVGNLDAMTDCIARLDSDRALLNQLSRAAQKHVQEHYAMSKYIEQFDAIVDAAWAHPPRQWPHVDCLTSPRRAVALLDKQISEMENSAFWKAQRVYVKWRRRLGIRT